MNKLKPCPFCGVRPKLLSGEGGTPWAHYSITCESKCCLLYSVTTGDFNKQETAIKAWNKRAK